VCQSRVHDVEELFDIWHGLQQGAVDSAIDKSGQRVKERHFEHLL